VDLNVEISKIVLVGHCADTRDRLGHQSLRLFYDALRQRHVGWFGNKYDTIMGTGVCIEEEKRKGEVIMVSPSYLASPVE